MRALRFPLVLALSTALLGGGLGGCLPIATTDDGSATTNESGSKLSIEDVYAATMALIAASQLTGMLHGETGVSQDGADAIAQRIRDRLGKQTCLAVSGSGATVAIDFQGGCALPGSPIPLQGKASATVSVSTAAGVSSVVLDLTLDAFGSGGKTATGGATLSMTEASDGLDVDLTTAMTAGDAALAGGIHVDVPMDSSTDTVTKSVTSTLADTVVKSGTAALAVDASAVTLVAGDCYPSAGSIVFTSAGIKATLAFDADTAATGTAQFTPPLSKKAEPKQLPGLGWKCQ